MIQQGLGKRYFFYMEPRTCHVKVIMLTKALTSNTVQ